MSKDDLPCLVRAGLRVGLVDRSDRKVAPIARDFAHAVNQEIEQGLLPKEKTDATLGLPPPQKPAEHAAV